MSAEPTVEQLQHELNAYDALRQRNLDRAIAAEAERDALKAELAAIHSAVVDVYGENYGGEDVAAEVRRLFTHLVEHEADVRRLRQSKNEALERAQAELAEARASGSHLAEVAADEYLALKAERDAAQAAIERVRAILDQPLLRTSDPERAGERFLARQIAAALDAQGAGRA